MRPEQDGMEFVSVTDRAGDRFLGSEKRAGTSKRPYEKKDKLTYASKTSEFPKSEHRECMNHGRHTILMSGRSNTLQS